MSKSVMYRLKNILAFKFSVDILRNSLEYIKGLIGAQINHGYIKEIIEIRHGCINILFGAQIRRGYIKIHLGVDICIRAHWRPNLAWVYLKAFWRSN